MYIIPKLIKLVKFDLISKGYLGLQILHLDYYSNKRNPFKLANS